MMATMGSAHGGLAAAGEIVKKRIKEMSMLNASWNKSSWNKAKVNLQKFEQSLSL